MKTITAVFLTAFAALIFAACGSAPANNGAATNTNTAPKAPAAPTVDALMALEKQAHEAYSKADSKFFEGFLSDKFAMLGMKGEHLSKADMVKMVATVKCDVKSIDLTDPQMAKIDNDTYVVSSKVSWDATCTEDGKSHKVPSPMRSASLYVRNGDKWMGAWHGETPIMGEKAEPKKDEPKAETKKDEPKAETKKDEPKKDATAKKTNDDGTKADSTSGEVKAPSSMASNAARNPSNAKVADPGASKDNGPLAADANTDALMKLHTAGWDAWKARDAKRLSDMTAASLSFVNPMGVWYGTKDAVLKEWTEAKCDIKSTTVADGFATALSPTAELLFAKGTATGTCDGPDGKPMKLGPLWNAAVYVKEGNDWRLAFLFESPA